MLVRVVTEQQNVGMSAARKGKEASRQGTSAPCICVSDLRSPTSLLAIPPTDFFYGLFRDNNTHILLVLKVGLAPRQSMACYWCYSHLPSAPPQALLLPFLHARRSTARLSSKQALEIEPAFASLVCFMDVQVVHEHLCQERPPCCTQTFYSSNLRCALKVLILNKAECFGKVHVWQQSVW
jgi:hypothetical protein